MLGRAARLCQHRHSPTAAVPVPGAQPQAGLVPVLGAEPGGTPAHRYPEGHQFVVSIKAAIPFQPSPKALSGEAAFKIEEAQVRGQMQERGERGGTRSQAAVLGCAGAPGSGVPVLCRLLNIPVPNNSSWTKGSKAEAVMPSLGWLHGTAPLAAPGTSLPLSPGSSASLQAFSDNSVTSLLHTQKRIVSISPIGCCWHLPSWLCLGDRSSLYKPSQIGFIYSGAYKWCFQEHLC